MEAVASHLLDPNVRCSPHHAHSNTPRNSRASRHLARLSSGPRPGMYKVSRIASQRVVGGTVVVRAPNTNNNVSLKRVDGDLRPSIRFGSAAGAFVYYAVTRGYRDQDRQQYCRSHVKLVDAACAVVASQAAGCLHVPQIARCSPQSQIGRYTATWKRAVDVWRSHETFGEPLRAAETNGSLSETKTPARSTNDRVEHAIWEVLPALGRRICHG
jgi:hypothetical protein